jgi:hypothetical protein
LAACVPSSPARPRFAALRLVLLLAALWRQYGREFRVDVGLWREQLGYALPFALPWASR